MSSKRKQILEVLGYCKHDNIDYLFVKWKGERETWERMDNINAKTLLDIFIEKTEKEIVAMKRKKMESEETEKNKFLYDKLIQARIMDVEKEINGEKLNESVSNDFGLKSHNINEKQGMKNSATSRIEKYKSEPYKTNNKEYSNERNKIMSNTYDSSNEKQKPAYNKDDDRTKKHYESKPGTYPKFKVHEARDKGLGANISKFYDMHKEKQKMMQFREFSISDTNINQPNKCNDVKQVTKTPVIEMRRAPGQRYFDHVVPIVTPKPIETKILSTMKFKLDENIVGSFSYPIKIESNDIMRLNTFSVDKIVNNLHVNTLLFNLFMNPNMSTFVSIYRIELMESIAMLDDLFNKMKNNKFSVVNMCDSQYINVFVLNSPIFQRFGYDYPFYMLKISKSLLMDCEDAAKILDTICNRNYGWNVERLQYNAFIENYLIFRMDTIELQKYGVYAIFSEECNPVSDDLNLLLKNDLFVKDENYNTIDTYFIHADYLQFINAIPNFDDLLLSSTQFYVFHIFSICKIFPKHGVYTVKLSLLTDIDKVGVLNVLRKYDKWKCYITKSNLDKFKSFIQNYRNDLRYNELNKLFTWLSTNVDAFVGSEYDFISHLRIKMHKEYRFFYIVDKQNDNKLCKTAGEIENVMAKHL